MFYNRINIFHVERWKLRLPRNKLMVYDILDIIHVKR
jgi:hypothetical protein